VLTIRRLALGSGFKYVMQSIAVGDGPAPGTSLATYYEASGTPTRASRTKTRPALKEGELAIRAPHRQPRPSHQIARTRAASTRQTAAHQPAARPLAAGRQDRRRLPATGGASLHPNCSTHPAVHGPPSRRHSKSAPPTLPPARCISPARQPDSSRSLSPEIDLGRDRPNDRTPWFAGVRAYRYRDSKSAGSPVSIGDLP
jgi:hypothetical protein